ncbi:MAG TPA: NAD(P) transhydrogenase subunit alpha [Candidatus Hydrogenedentes bacterium]|nr:NAD(P) transhydrogenase subunit alpha [Candidatus Hydrogenedentota bacterium]HPG65850.1 NAD(P) transhydrogenase subunit alpha [Candidatus Hydrogenedentota bacterium]
MRFQGLTIGVPKEIMDGERRVAAVPETVTKMVAEGARVLVECGAGEGIGVADSGYEQAGAEMVHDVEGLYAGARLVLKVKEPLFNASHGKHEVEMMGAGQFLIAFLHPASPANHPMVRLLAERNVTAFTLDGVPRISRAQSMDALTSMSTVAGYKAVLMAADRLPKFMPMVGTAVGTVRPARVLAVGIGVAGLQALATAKKLGAVVDAADIRPEACEHAKSLGAKVVDLGIPPELAEGKGGYARHLPKEWLLKEQAALAGPVASADVLILAALVPGKVAPVLVTESMAAAMAPGSVIVDVAIDQGGNCAVTEPGRCIEWHGLTIEGIKNIPGMVPLTATWLFSHNIFSFVSYLVEEGVVRVARSDEIIASSLVTEGGRIVHEGALEAMSANAAAG